MLSSPLPIIAHPKPHTAHTLSALNPKPSVLDPLTLHPQTSETSEISTLNPRPLTGTPLNPPTSEISSHNPRTLTETQAQGPRQAFDLAFHGLHLPRAGSLGFRAPYRAALKGSVRILSRGIKGLH